LQRRPTIGRIADQPTPPLFDVALTYASEQREYVRAVATTLHAHGITYFFDEEQRLDLWGRNLLDVADTTYRLSSLFVAMFVSADYAKKMWPNVERQSAQSRAIQQAEPYILPIRFDDTDIPGLLPATIYEDARKWSAEEIGALLAAKVAMTRGREDVIMEDRSPGWEHLMLIDELQASVAGYEREWRDHLTGYARPGARRITLDEVREDLQTRMAAATSIIGNIDRLFRPEVIELALGPPGVPGDADQIRHWANRVIDVYGFLLAWSADTRGALAPDEAQEAYLTLAEMVDTPLRQFREFVAGMDRDMRPVIAALRADDDHGPVELLFQLTLTIDDEIVARFHGQMEQLGEYL
jgi:hypothetical protein